MPIECTCNYDDMLCHCGAWARDWFEVTVRADDGEVTERRRFASLDAARDWARMLIADGGLTASIRMVDLPEAA